MLICHAPPQRAHRIGGRESSRWVHGVIVATGREMKSPRWIPALNRWGPNRCRTRLSYNLHHYQQPMPDSGPSHRPVCCSFCSLICSVAPPSLLSSLIVSLGHLADTGLRAPGFLWTRHFPKITWAKHFHSQAGWGPAEAAALMGKRWISAGWRHPCTSTRLRANTFIILMLRWRELMMMSPIHGRICFYNLFCFL